MDDASAQAMSMLNALLGGGAGPQSRPWTSYGGINTTGPMTAIQQMRGHITDAATSMLGPTFGPLAGYFASNWLVGKDFTKQGLLHNRFSGLLAPTAGTYANAFQRVQRQQTISMLQSGKKAAQEDLKRAFIREYYQITNPIESGNIDWLKGQVQEAMDNGFSLPSILNYTIDPAQNRRTLQGIKDSQAGFLYWQQRMNPQGLNTDVVKRKDLADQLGEGIKDMAVEANRWIFGGGQGGYKNSFGGFGGGSVAELASILQNASNQMDPAHMTQSINAFKDKVKKTAQALSPLKDIFGQDIKAMTDMLQSVTGQNINQLTPTMIQSIATNTVDMSRYSGATIAQIAGAGQKLFQQTAALGGNSFSRIGGSLTGAYYTGLIAQGNAPAGVHAAQYAGNTQRAIASAQASAGVDRAAMAFGLWQEANPNGTIDDFMAKVRENRADSGTMMQAIVKTVNQATKGNYTEQSLVKGLATTGYRVSLQSGKLAQLGVSQQYRVKLADSFNYLRQANLGGEVSDQALVALQGFMSNSANSAAVKDLVTNANDKNAVDRFARDFAKKNGLSFDAARKAVNFAINRGQILQEASRWSADIQMAKFSASQKQIRDAMGEVDASGTGAYISLWRAVSAGKLDEKGNLKLSNGNVIKAAALQAHTRAILGGGNLQQNVDKLGKAFGGGQQGKQQAIQLLATASSVGLNDAALMQNIKDITGNTEGAAQAKRQIKARMSGYLTSSISAASFTKESGALAEYNKALQEYNKNPKAKDAGKNLQRGIRRAQRMQKISQGHLKLGVGKDQLEKFSKLVKDSNVDVDALYAMSDSQLNGKTGNLSVEDFRKTYRATSTNYDRKADLERLLVTTLQKMNSYLSRILGQGNNKNQGGN